MSYLKFRNPRIKILHDIYSKDFPEFLKPFLEAPELKRLHGITQYCGLPFSKLFQYNLVISRLDHSVGVALIVRNFTKDIKQTLAGLFHDISHTVFSHVGDFYKGDHLYQKSSEVYVSDKIKNSIILMKELKKLGIKIEETEDYTIYPIADNNLPRLAADRLEYNILGLTCWKDFDYKIIEQIYENITVLKNEDNIDELGFQDENPAYNFGKIALNNDKNHVASYEAKIGMSFLSEILKESVKCSLIRENDIYTLTDEDIFEIIEKSNNPELLYMLNFFKNLGSYKIYETMPNNGKFFVDSKIKKRWIDPLVITKSGNKRLSEINN
ncbi:MAG: HD domain-containing protein, partial [Candidatus Gracilibacteria bacterium]|nr:HD domain-containing protein [Candidatus Gracilibacteria bacterium]